MIALASSGSSQDVVAWGALATGVAALMALVVGISTIFQKSKADKRSEWWRRTQWAIDQTNSSQAQTREAGLIVMLHQLESKLATNDERRLLRDVALNLMRRVAR